MDPKRKRIALMKNTASHTQIPQALYDALPSITWRTDPRFQEFTGISRRRMANLDCLGQGPSERICMGRNRVGYERDVLAAWLAGRLRLESRKSIPDEAA